MDNGTGEVGAIPTCAHSTCTGADVIEVTAPLERCPRRPETSTDGVGVHQPQRAAGQRENPGLHDNYLPGGLSVNSTTSAVIVTLGTENKIKYVEDWSSVWFASATARPVSGSPTDL